MIESGPIYHLLKNKIPSTSLTYCFELWKRKKFILKVTPERKSKMGDFRWRKNQPIQTITINGNLNTYQFLITYIHEVAHLYVFSHYGIHIQAHGPEWKRAFQQLMAPLLFKQVFPQDILIPLMRHMRNPKASSAGDIFLARELNKYDKGVSETKKVLLADLKSETIFVLAGKKFKKKESRRTRVVCEEIDSGKQYLIALAAHVEVIQQA
jgi:hypothetical protein